MHKLELKVPPVILFLVALGAIYFSTKFINTLLSDTFTAVSGYQHALAYLFTVLGVLSGVVGVITFKRARTTVNPVSIENASNLVTHGIFRYSRNPMYLGMALILIGAACYTNANIYFSIVVLFCFCLYMTTFQIKPEERMLTSLFGQAYLDYLAATRRWI